MELEINKIYNMDCIDGLRLLPDNSVDLTVTSPPYDNLRTYQEGDEFRWDFEIFKPIARELYRVTKPGCVVVWVVGDATINGDETGTSFKQAQYFKEIGFKLHDTMIYEKNGSSRPAGKNAKRYSQIFEYMFVFVKGEIRKDITLIADKRNKWAGWAKWGKNTTYDVDGNLVEVKKNQPVIKEYSYRNNIWRYSVSFNDKTGHPAVFPELLAQDHILSWSVEGDLVLDPFMGSGTTAKMAKLNKRNYLGFEKNTEYYEKSIERVAKYDGQVNTELETTNIETEDGDEVEIQYSTSEDKEFEKKSKLWDELIEKLNQYFDEQTYGTLKTLQFNFVTKTNENRVKKITEQEDIIENVLPNMEKLADTILVPEGYQDINGDTTPVPENYQDIEGDTIPVPENHQPSQVPNECTQINVIDCDNQSITAPIDKPTELSIDNTSVTFKDSVKEIVYDVITNDFNCVLQRISIDDIIASDELKERIISTVVDYFPNMKRLPDVIVETNRKAREEKQKKTEEPEKRHPIQFVELREQDFVKKEEVKPKRKRRTKAEMEAARKAEAEKKWEELGVTKEIQEDIKQHISDLPISTDHAETVINPNETITTQADYTLKVDENSSISVSTTEGEPNTSCTQVDDLPFVYTNEEVAKMNEPVVEVKRGRGRPRKNPVK